MQLLHPLRMVTLPGLALIGSENPDGFVIGDCDEVFSGGTVVDVCDG